MTPTRALEVAIAALIGADTANLAEGTTFVAVHLAKQAFTPSPTLLLGTIVEADFDGSDELHAASAATQVFSDPGSGDQVIQVREPAGGWHWVTTGTTHLPQIIYGFYLTNAAGTVLLASESFSTPITLTAAGQGIDLGEVHLRLPSGVIQ